MSNGLPRCMTPLREVFYTVGTQTPPVEETRRPYLVYTTDVEPSKGTLRFGYFYAKAMARAHFQETYQEAGDVDDVVGAVENDPNDGDAEMVAMGSLESPRAPWDGGTVEVRVYLTRRSRKPLGAWKVTGEPERWKVEELPR